MVSPETKLPKVSVAVFALISALLIGGSTAAVAQIQMSEAQARLGAQDHFATFCAKLPKCDAADFTGPKVIPLDGAAFAYRWKGTNGMPKDVQVSWRMTGGWVITYVE